VDSILCPCQQFFNLRLQKKSTKAPYLFTVKVICSDHSFLQRDSYKGVNWAITLDESMLRKIFIICQRAKQVASLEKSISWRFLVDVCPSVMSIFALSRAQRCKLWITYPTSFFVLDEIFLYFWKKEFFFL